MRMRRRPIESPEKWSHETEIGTAGLGRVDLAFGILRTDSTKELVETLCRLVRYGKGVNREAALCTPDFRDDLCFLPPTCMRLLSPRGEKGPMVRSHVES